MAIKDYSNIVLNARKKKKDEDKNSSSSVKDYSSVVEKQILSKSINLDSLHSDLNTVAKTIDSVYNGWQTRETMENTKASIQGIHDRLAKYQEYQKKYGGTDLSDVHKSFEGILGGWEDLTRDYAKYKNADAYKSAVKSAKEKREKESKADLGTVQTEITGLEEILNNAKKQQGNVKKLRDTQSYAANRSYGLSGDIYKDEIESAEKELNALLKKNGYESVDAIEKALGEKKAFLKNATRTQEVIKLGSVGDINSENYDAEYNDYVSKGKAIPFEEVGTEKRKRTGGAGKARAISRTVKSDTRLAAEALNAFVSGETKSNEDASLYDESAIFSLMTEGEFNNFAYYIAKDKEDGGNRAEQYVNSIKETLNYRRGEEIAKGLRDKNFSQFMFGVDAGLDQFGSGIKNVFSNEDYIPVSHIQAASGEVREDIKYEHGGIAQVGYDLINTTSNMLPSILASSLVGAINPTAGAVVGAGLMGTSASGNAYQEMLNLGYDKNQARTYSALVGISEAGLQYAMGGIGKLGGVSGKLSKLVSGIDNGLARFALQWGGSALSEGFEEAAQEVLNPLFQNIAAGYDTGADVDWSEVVYSGLLGALSGGVMEGAPLAVNSIGESYTNNRIGRDIKANERTSELFDIASNPEVASAYETYTRYANKGINAENISDAKLGRLYTNAKLDAQETLQNKKASSEQKQSAISTLSKLGDIETEVAVKKVAKKLNVGEETKITESGETVDIKNLKVKGDEVTFATNEGDVSVDDMTLTQRDAELVVLAKGISKTEGEDIANVFIDQYDGNTDAYEYSTSFNLAVNYAKNNFPEETILENKGSLSTSQVKAIYKATVINEANARETKLENLANEQGKNMTIQGEFDDSIIDYNNSTTDGSKVNWRSLSSTQKAAIKFTKLFSKATGVNIKFIKSNVKDGKHQGKNGSYNPSTNTIEIDVYAGRIDASVFNDAIIPTLSHELTHWMKAKSPAIFNSIKDDVIKTLKEGTGLSSDTIIAKELGRLNKAHPDKEHTIDEAVEEIVARACEDMLSNSNAARKLLNKMSETEQQSFIEKVKETFENLIQWINDLLAHYKSTSEEAKILREYKDMLKKVSKQWDEMLIKSVKVNQALEKSGAYGHKSDVESVRHSIREEYANEIEAWEKDGMPDGETFILGTTGDVLQGLGAIESDIYMLSKKINKILKDHPEMTIDEIKKIPQILENPILILKSQNIGRDDADNTRLVVFGNIKAKDGRPILSVLDLKPIENHLAIDDMQKVSSAYTKDTDPVDFVKNSLVVYADKKRTTKLLRTIGFSAPIELQLSGYIGSIAYVGQNVNIKGEEFSKVFNEVNELNSDRDSTGRELSKGQIEYFKDSTVRDENGNLKVMYRGDSSEFTVFDKKKTKHSNLYGRGFYFTDSKAHAEQYGGSREFYLDIKNPLSPKQNAITKKQMLNFLKAIENDGEDYDLYNYGQDATAESVLNSVWGKGDFEMLQDINAGAIGDLVAAVELFNEVNGTSYDGIILPTETVTFNSEQAKLTSNLNPTEDKDMRFSMRENVEETREFVAVHNLSAEKLLKALKLGGLPMPSIAITRAREGWNNFGDISLVFNKDTIDPQFLRSNKVYSGDAWTPTYPRIAYKVNTKAQEKIREKINGLVPGSVQSDLGGLHLDSSNMEGELNRHGDMVKSYRYNYAMKYAFLKDNNVNIELPTMDEPLYRHGEVSNSAVISFAHKMVDGLKTVNSLLEQHSSKLMDDMELINGIATVLNEEVLSTVEENTDAYQKLVESPVFKPEDINLSTVLGMLEAARKYFNKNGKIDSKIDYKEARNLVDEKTDMAKYESWLKDLFSEIVAKEGIRNNKDLYTPSGNRRSFEALHYEHNLENVIKAMKEEGTKGIGGFGGGNIFGASTKEYSSIDELKADAENRMQLLPESKYEEIKKGFSDRFFELANSLPIHKDSFSAIDDAANMLIEAISKFKTKSGMANYLRTESKGWANYSDYIVDDLIELVNEIRNMPVSYFEAKPQRAVGYDEIKAVIMPAQYSYEDDISEVKAELEKLNIPILEYEYGDNNARIKALNSLEEVRFSDRDTEYLELAKDPVKNESRLREMVYEAAKEKGYTDDSSWRMQHSAPNSKEDVSLDKLKESGLVPDDYWEHPEWYTYSPEERESYYKVKKAIEMQERRKSEGNPRAAHMWVYRAVDKTKNKREDYFRNGDWVTPSYEYAVNEGKMNPNGYRIIKHSVSIKDLYWDGNSIAELGYDDGSNYAYADTLNNRKLLDLVTYDYDGNIIPLSKRFNRREYDVRYSDREETSVYDLMGETERVKKENEKFKAEIERLKERLKLERTVTNGNYFNENQLGVVAGHLRNISKSLIAKDKLVDSLRDVYSFIAHSPELTWEEVFERCYRIADSMIAEAKPEKMADDYSKHILREIKSKRISLSEAQKKEAQHIFGKNWNRNFFGSVVITDGGISLEDQWQEWASMYPGIFDADITDTDMPGELYDIIGSLRDASETVIEYNTEEQTRWLAREIYNQYWNVSPIRTTADKYDKQIKLLNFEHRRIMTEFREDYNTRLKEQRKTDREKYQKLAKEIRERKDKQIAQAKEHGREMIDKYKDNAERKTRIQRITANALTLNKWLTKNSKDYHIHEAMKGPVIKLLNAIDFSSKSMLEKGEPTQKDISFAEAFSDVKSMLENATNMVEGFEVLYGHDLAEGIKLLTEGAFSLIGDNNYVINAMTNEQLFHLDRLVSHIKKVVTELNKFHVVNHNQGAVNLANEFMEHGEKLGNLKKQHGTMGKLFEFRNRTPYYFFKDLGKVGEKLFKAFQDGWDKLAFNAKKVIDFAQETYTAKEVKEWTKETKQFKIPQFDGTERTFEMSIAQIMALHCVSKQKDAQNHLLSGGMTLKRIDKKGRAITDYDNITLTLSDIKTILSSLTDRQKEVADKLQNFMNTVCSDWGNEISMARFGIEMFGIPDYFPIKVSDATHPEDNSKEVDHKSLFRLLNMSFTKARKEGSPESIEIGDIFDIFAQHSSDMAKYNALALPVLDFNKFYSIKGMDLANKERGVVKTLKSVFGDEANGYIIRFVRDLNGSQNVSRDVIGNTFFKNAKVASVAANLRVVLLQPTAFFKASAVMDNKYLLKASAYIKVEPVGMVKKLKKAIADAEKYCGIVQWKSLGYYDTDISKGLTEKIKHADGFKDKAIEKSLKLAEIADKVTFGTLWIASEFEIRDTRKDLKVGSEEFYNAIANRLRDVIYATQVVDSTMTRSDMMRSSDGRDKMLTAFGSEPIIAYNMLLDMVTQYNRDKKEFGNKEARKMNSKKIRKVVTAYVITNAVAALVESGFDALRDDDDEEIDVIEFMKLYLKNFAFDMSVGNKLPGIKEAYAFLQGYSSSRMDTQWLQSAYYAMKDIKKLTEGEGSWMKTIKDTIKAMSYLSGLPFYNAYRDAMALLEKLGILDEE